MDVDIGKLHTAFTPYWGRDGEMAKTHIEAHRGNNEKLFKLLTDSTGVELAFAGDSKVNPSIIVRRADHKRVVEHPLHGGYASVSTARISRCGFPHLWQNTASGGSCAPQVQISGMCDPPGPLSV